MTHPGKIYKVLFGVRFNLGAVIGVYGVHGVYGVSKERELYKTGELI